MKNYLLFSLFILCFLTYIPNSQAQEENPDKKFKTEINETVPEFSFTTIDGKEHKISDYKGKVVWLNFFATWCGPCINEIPHLRSLSKEMNGKDAIILYIGRKHSKEQLLSFAKKMSMDESAVVEDPEKEVYLLFADKYIPRNLIIDKQGKIIQQTTGYEKALFEKMVKQFKELEEQE